MPDSNCVCVCVRVYVCVFGLDFSTVDQSRQNKPFWNVIFMYFFKLIKNWLVVMIVFTIVFIVSHSLSVF